VVSGVNSVGVKWAGERLAALPRPGQVVIAVASGVRARGTARPRILPRCCRAVAPDLREQVGWVAIIGPATRAGGGAARDVCGLRAGPGRARPPR
jgi:glycerol-3-phosphate dehydrogenase (NAD(P)+)